ncbi:MAG: acyltransferase family protein [Sphaerospermopsis kisseleviana]
MPDWFNYQFSGWSLWHQVIMCLLTGAHMLQYWFIPMIIIFYTVSAILIWMDRNPWLYWLIPLLIVVTLIIPRPDFNNNSFQSFIHFFSIYVTGMFCSHFKERFFIVMRKWYILPTCVFVILTALEYFWMPIAINANSVNSVSKLILSGLLIYFFWLNEQYLPTTIDKTMGLLAEYSFGIFFLHEYFILGGLSLAGKIGIKSQFVNYSLLTFIIQCFFSIGGSVIVITLIKKIFGKNSRWVVGC